MEKAAWVVRHVCFDAHCAHAWFREAMFGHLETLRLQDLKKVPFFRDLVFEDVPRHVLPWLPLKLAIYDGLPVSALPGVCLLGLE